MSAYINETLSLSNFQPADPSDSYIRCTEYEQHSETGMVRRCILEIGHTIKHTHTIRYARSQNVSKKWAKLFLYYWRRAVYLWDNGKLFSESHRCHLGRLRFSCQQEYAQICCVWIIPNGFTEPHVVAEGG